MYKVLSANESAGPEFMARGGEYAVLTEGVSVADGLALQIEAGGSWVTAADLAVPAGTRLKLGSGERYRAVRHADENATAQVWLARLDGIGPGEV